MVTVEINNNTCKLSGDFKVLRKLYKHLKFKHPNAYHIRKAIKYEWDGYVTPLTPKGSMQTGLLASAIEFLSDYEDEYELIDHRRFPEIGTIPTEVGGLKLEGKYAYQKRTIEAVVYNTLLGTPHPRGIVAAAVNAGKSTIMMGIHMSYVGAKTLILVNSKELYTQFKGDLAKAFPDSHGYMQGKSIKWGDIMVVMVQTLKLRLKEYSKKLMEYNVLLTDECDLAGNATFEKVYRSLSHIAVRAGFTGTVFLRNLKKDQLRNNQMREIFGDIVFEITNLELEDSGVSAKTIVKSIQMNQRVISGLGFKEEFDELVTYNEKHHQKVLERTLYNLRTNKRYVLIFCKFIKQTELVYEYLSKHLPPKYSLEYTHHKRSTPEIIQGFREGKINVLVTSLYLKRGMNFPKTRAVINISGGSWLANPLQILGRGSRITEVKNRLFFEDFYDNGKYLGPHSRGRIKKYRGVGYKIRIIT